MTELEKAAASLLRDAYAHPVTDLHLVRHLADGTFPACYRRDVTCMGKKLRILMTFHDPAGDGKDTFLYLSISDRSPVPCLTDGLAWSVVGVFFGDRQKVRAAGGFNNRQFELLNPPPDFLQTRLAALERKSPCTG